MTDLPVQPQPTLEPAKLFNDFQAQSRARMEAALKLVMILAGGMLTLSVSAVLGSAPSRIPVSYVGQLAWAWGLLFYSIAAATIVMAGMIAATFHMGVRWRKRMEEGRTPGTFFVATWTWLRVANAVVGISALLSFLAGIVLISQVAIGVAHAAEPPKSPPVPTGASTCASDTSRVPAVANPKRDEPAAEVPPAAVAAISAKQTNAEIQSAQDRAAKAELDRKLVDFNGDLAHYTGYLVVLGALQIAGIVAQLLLLLFAFRQSRRAATLHVTQWSRANAPLYLSLTS